MQAVSLIAPIGHCRPLIMASQLLGADVQGLGVPLVVGEDGFRAICHPTGQTLGTSKPRSPGPSAGAPTSQGSHMRDAMWPRGRQTHLGAWRPGFPAQPCTDLLSREQTRTLSGPIFSSIQRGY